MGCSRNCSLVLTTSSKLTLDHISSSSLVKMFLTDIVLRESDLLRLPRKIRFPPYFLRSSSIETWVDNSIPDDEVSLPGYSIFKSDRTNGRGGGIAGYVKETLSVISRADLEKDFIGECMWLELLLPKAEEILFGTFYRPPSPQAAQTHVARKG